MTRWIIVNKATNKIEYAYKSDVKHQGDGMFPGAWDNAELCDHIEMPEELEDQTLNMVKVEAGEVKLAEAEKKPKKKSKK